MTDRELVVKLDAERQASMGLDKEVAKALDRAQVERDRGQAVAQSLQVELEKKGARVRELEGACASERESGDRVRAEAHRWRERAARAEGHLRLLASYGGCVWEKVEMGEGRRVVGEWCAPGESGSERTYGAEGLVERLVTQPKNAGLESMIAGILKRQQAVNTTQEVAG